MKIIPHITPTIIEGCAVASKSIVQDIEKCDLASVRPSSTVTTHALVRRQAAATTALKLFSSTRLWFAIGGVTPSGTIHSHYHFVKLQDLDFHATKDILELR